jgi:hypothetical protein
LKSEPTIGKKSRKERRQGDHGNTVKMEWKKRVVWKGEMKESMRQKQDMHRKGRKIKIYELIDYPSMSVIISGYQQKRKGEYERPCGIRFLVRRHWREMKFTGGTVI